MSHKSWCFIIVQWCVGRAASNFHTTNDMLKARVEAKTTALAIISNQRHTTMDIYCMIQSTSTSALLSRRLDQSCDFNETPLKYGWQSGTKSLRVAFSCLLFKLVAVPSAELYWWRHCFWNLHICAVLQGQGGSLASVELVKRFVRAEGRVFVTSVVMGCGSGCRNCGG